ncbi:hypothetical protein SAV14893_014150 [Streptomyces avermitilis]|uniref:ABC transmembrane type-1 domain-containing protein n=1 Tax=Streptomyces avermitilis TaxID=33903 RepID=A0A4D4LKY6_STRAX|nr:hypothetical protein SAVMC3_26340 [Streptomyces avermitilis]GDY62022.1 hypothetical protein SAV14893_014150 [Streptomyces avermitilis]GDY86749.1 hypothetical protein SAVCW2_59480 [Streptomyces avermitilis]
MGTGGEPDPSPRDHLERRTRRVRTERATRGRDAFTVCDDFCPPFRYAPTEDLGVISTSLFRFRGPFGAHWGTISAGAVLVVLPTLIVFLFLQRFIRNGFTRAVTK